LIQKEKLLFVQKKENILKKRGKQRGISLYENGALSLGEKKGDQRALGDDLMAKWD
jgi:hypothetical protein